MNGEIIDGKKIADEIKNKARNKLKILLKNYTIIPKITTIKIGSNKESDLYLRLRDKACKEVGIQSVHKEFPTDISEDNLIQALDELNKDEDVHGILIQFPLPKHISEKKILKCLDPKKDVEGLTPFNMGRTILGDEYIVPITPLAVLTILEHEKIQLKGQNITIVNHSNVVGKPLASLLLNRNATVSICHVFTKNLRQFTEDADVLISGAGVPKLITYDIVKKDSVIIDVAVVSSERGISGDVDFDKVKERVKKITPVPGGVGPVTVACSINNMLKTAKYCIGEKINEIV